MQKDGDFDTQPSTENGDGDGTVNFSSLEVSAWCIAKAWHGVLRRRGMVYCEGVVWCIAKAWYGVLRRRGVCCAVKAAVRVAMPVVGDSDVCRGLEVRLTRRVCVLYRGWLQGLYREGGDYSGTYLACWGVGGAYGIN